MERTERSREFHVDGAAWAKPRVVICNETQGTDNRSELDDRNRLMGHLARLADKYMFPDRILFQITHTKVLVDRLLGRPIPE